MKYKLVAIDMDGTLLNNNNEVSERTRKAIDKAKEKGVHIVISTGRVLKSALYYGKSLNLRAPIIACNGAIIADESDNIIYKNSIDKNLIKSIIDIAKERNIYYHFYDESRFYSHVKVEEVLKFYNEGNKENSIDIKVFENIEEIIEDKDLNVYKFIFIDENKDNLQNLRRELGNIDNIGISSSWANNIEAMGCNVSKGEAVKELCTKLNIKPEEVIAIGDSENDLPMLRFAGLGVAMGNGNQIIKKEADYITDTNQEDGVAKVIEKFILE